MRLLITGSRGWKDEARVEAEIRHHKRVSEERGEEFVLIHGHCKSGADAVADRVAKRLGMEPGKDLIRVPADWKRYKGGAGTKRNQRMLDEFDPDLVIAFRAPGKSNGTDDMIELAHRACVQVRLVGEVVA